MALATWPYHARSAGVGASAPKSPVFPLPLRSHLRPYSPTRPFSEWATIHPERPKSRLRERRFTGVIGSAADLEPAFRLLLQPARLVANVRIARDSSGKCYDS